MFLGLVSIQLACSNSQSKNVAATSPVKQVSTAPISGADVDKHGCKASAGYTWSVLKNSCIRVFETGISLAPKAAHLDTTTVAHIVFKSDDEDAQVEVFLPNKEGSLLMDKIAEEDAGAWQKDTFTLRQWRGMYMLNDSKGNSLYEGMAVK